MKKPAQGPSSAMASLNASKNQIVYASELTFIQPVLVEEATWHQVRNDVVSAVPDFTLYERRENQEYLLKRHGHTNARQEYMLKVTPSMITVAAGKGVAVEKFHELYRVAWKAVQEHIRVTRTNISTFDVSFTWELQARGNPYLRAICPAVLRPELLHGLSHDFLVEFDPVLRFQTRGPKNDTMYVLRIFSPLSFEDVASLKQAETNDVRIKLGAGLSADFFGSPSSEFKAVVDKHWTNVCEIVGTEIFPALVKPLLARMQTTLTRKKINLSRQNKH